MIRLGLRTGWVSLLAWPFAAAALVAATAGSIASLYPTPAQRSVYAATVGSSAATEAFNGRGYALDTLGGIAAYEIGFMGQLLFPLMALHLALRLTRREEQSGRTELLTATRIGRDAPPAAAAALLLAAAALTGVLTAAGMLAAGLPATGSAWYAASLAALLLFFGGLGLLLGQVAQATRTAYALGVVAVSGAFLVRAVIDGLGWSATWVSPLGWFAEARAFGDRSAWPPAAYVLGALTLAAAAWAVSRSRDLGGGIVGPRPGPARGGVRVATPSGLAWRLNRGAAASWAAVAVVWAGVFGALSQEMAALVQENPMLLQALGLQRGTDLVTSLAIVVVCLGATAMAAQGFGRLGSEEDAGRLGAVLSTGVSRRRVWLAWIGVVAGSSLAVLAAGVLALGLATAAVTGSWSDLWPAAGAGAGYAVPVLAVVAAAALLRAGVPRAGGAVWLLVVWIVLVGFLADTLRLPQWSRHLSPVHLVGRLPIEEIDVLAVVALAAGAVLATLASLVLFTRRDLRAG